MVGWKKYPTVGTTWGASKLGGLNIKEVPAAPKIKACIEVVLREHVPSSDPLRKWGRPMPRIRGQNTGSGMSIDLYVPLLVGSSYGSKTAR